jgi:hypothetical protein
MPIPNRCQMQAAGALGAGLRSLALVPARAGFRPARLFREAAFTPPGVGCIAMPHAVGAAGVEP